MLRTLMSVVIGRASRQGSKVWVTVAMLAWAGRLARKMMVNEERVVFSERMGPGERLVISNVTPPKRR